MAAAAARPVLGALGANERVRLGFIGLGNRGDQLIDAFQAVPDVQITALCDVYEPYIGYAKRKVGGEPFTTGHYRKLLDRKDVDAVVIATPDHWHALQFIDACAAGKDVYVEKPLSLTIGEGRRMVEAAKRYGRVTQMGVQRRSSDVCRRVVELVQGGAIGKVTAARCFHATNETPMGMGPVPDGDPPPGLDWDMWLGPAPKVPYNENRCLYKFRWYRSYSGGQLTNMGTHYLDHIQWALGQDAPLGVFAAGGRYAIHDGREIPDTMEVVWEYPGGVLVTFTQFNANAAELTPVKADIEIRGTQGTLYFSGRTLRIVPEKVRLEPLAALNPTRRKENARQAAAVKPAREAHTESGRMEVSDHAADFIDCVRSRKTTHCPVEVGHRSTTATLLGNLAYDRKRYLAWDAEKEQVTNDPEANKLLNYEYRSPWKLA
ncbi:MAG: dehydrogenase [Phycisphaerae bacterium]